MNNILLPLPAAPIGRRDDLRAAFVDLEQAPSGSARNRAVFHVAVALGRCRLHGIELGEDLDGVLPPDMAVVATRETTHLLTVARMEADALEQRWDRSVDSSEADNYCSALLGVRMDAWAVGLVLEEAYHACASETPAELEGLQQAIDSMRRALDDFDGALEQQTGLLSTLAGTNLLKNWRASLAAKYREALPWWLDGHLEDEAERIKEESVRTMPGRGVWAVLRHVSTDIAGNRLTADRTTAFWKSVFPELVPTGLLAAKPQVESPPKSVLAIRWQSPDKICIAQMNLPSSSNMEEDAIPRPINVCSVDGEPAIDYNGEPLVLGTFHGTIDASGKVWASLGELRDACDGRLYVGKDRTEWKLDPVEVV